MGNRTCCYEAQISPVKKPSKKGSFKQTESFLNEVDLMKTEKQRSSLEMSKSVKFKTIATKADNNLLNSPRMKMKKSKSICKSREEIKVKEYFKKMTEKKRKTTFKKKVTIMQTIQLKKEISNFNDS